jgi:hypothetical protein
MKTLQVQVNEDTYIKSYLEVLNGIMKLSDKELEVLEVFLRVNPKEPCSHEFKEAVVRMTGMKNIAVLNNYIKKFKDKGILTYKEPGLYYYNEILDPKNFRDGLCFKFVQNGAR